jgi:hypothetical protein
VLYHFPESIDSRIRLAIQRTHLIEVRYKGQSRIAEPHDYGVQRGVERLLVYQLRTTGGGAGKDAVGWRLFDVSKIESLVVLEGVFKGSRRASGQEHHSWDVLYARVEG